MIADAKAKGARVVAGGEATGQGNFFLPTALADVPLDADAMNPEPFGPMALMRPFATEEEALEPANRLPYGLPAFAFPDRKNVVSGKGWSRRVEFGGRRTLK